MCCMLKTTLNIFTLSSLWFENMSMLGLKYVDVLTLLGYSLLQMQRFIDVSFFMLFADTNNWV